MKYGNFLCRNLYKLYGNEGKINDSKYKHYIDNLGLVEGEEIKLKYVCRCVGFRRSFLLKATKG
jgi:hypothetical protein